MKPSEFDPLKLTLGKGKNYYLEYDNIKATVFVEFPSCVALKGLHKYAAKDTELQVMLAFDVTNEDHAEFLAFADIFHSRMAELVKPSENMLPLIKQSSVHQNTKIMYTKLDMTKANDPEENMI